MNRYGYFILLLMSTSTASSFAFDGSDSLGSVRRWRVTATLMPVKTVEARQEHAVREGETLLMFAEVQSGIPKVYAEQPEKKRPIMVVRDTKTESPIEPKATLRRNWRSGIEGNSYERTASPPRYSGTEREGNGEARIGDLLQDKQTSVTSDPDGLVAFAWEEENRLPIDKPLGNPRLEVNKQKRILYIYDGDKLIRRYKVSLGRSPELPKRQFKDGLTPEGQYLITSKSTKSKYHKNLAIGYPNLLDAKWGLENGLITQKEFQRIKMALEIGETPTATTKLGGSIFIHGEGRTNGDWTEGCIALKNEEVDELFSIIPLGTPIQLYWK
ncbi:MAG: L,D-transpeptidase [Bacteroidetes Order II. Incertae sedis bacterium]|nr:L,D-transpeptidase [Bacteroidetes Order II. bacterium]